MAITLNLGSSGEFIPSFISLRQSVASGVTGDLVTITPPAGKRVALVYLATVLPQTGISIDVNGSDVVSLATLSESSLPTNDAFRVGNGGSAGGVVDKILTKLPNQAIKIKKDAGNTTEIIYYFYAYGD